jgi:hypothetical protein
VKIIKMSELLYAEPKPQTIEERKERHDKILADLNTPVQMGRATAVTYDHKSDRYAVAFSVSEKKLTLKATNEVVAFVSEHISEAGYWLGRLEAGALVDVNLIQS